MPPVPNIFAEDGTLLYAARHRDNDVEAIKAATRRGVQLPQIVVVIRADQPPRKYRVLPNDFITLMD